MKKSLQDKLFQHYPSLYSRPEDTLMRFGFEVHDGWYELIDAVSDIITRRSPDAHARQVKEKFGGLRFYYGGGDAYCHGAARLAEELSYSICEVCGAPGSVYNNGGWISTTCAEHAADYAKDRNLDNIETDYEIEVTPVYGLGPGWARLILILENAESDDAKSDNRPPARLFVAVKNGKLSVSFSGGNEETAGRVDLINRYAGRIDQHTGRVVDDL